MARGHASNLAARRAEMPVNDGSRTFVQPEQLPLRWSEADELTHAWSDDEGGGVLRLVQEYVHARTLKEVAFILDRQASAVANGLAERDQHRVEARLLVSAVMHDRTRAVIRRLCELAGGEFVEPEALTDAEKVRRYEAEFRALGDVGATIRTRALGGSR